MPRRLTARPERCTSSTRSTWAAPAAQPIWSRDGGPISILTQLWWLCFPIRVIVTIPQSTAICGCTGKDCGGNSYPRTPYPSTIHEAYHRNGPEFSGTAAHTKMWWASLVGKSSYCRHEHCTHRLHGEQYHGQRPLVCPRSGWVGFQTHDGISHARALSICRRGPSRSFAR